MWHIAKRLTLGLILIALASSILLFSDWSHRTGKRKVTRNPDVRKIWNVRLVALIESAATEQATEGVLAGLKESGLVEGRDYTLRYQNAQGDMATLNTMIDSAVTDRVNMIITLTTPALQAAVKKAPQIPIIFSLVVNPASWGGAKSENDHPPNMTGIYLNLPAKEMIQILRDSIPNVRRVGSLFTPSESNSVFIKTVLEEALKENGIELVTLPASSSSEVAEAAVSLTQQQIDAICQIPDNLGGAAFPSILQAARKAKLPLFCFNTEDAKRGAPIAVAYDHYDNGRESALVAAQVIRGANPPSIPLRTPKTIKIAVYPEAARLLGFRIPDKVIKKAGIVIGE